MKEPKEVSDVMCEPRRDESEKGKVMLSKALLTAVGRRK
jgi:hypothetical protein